MVRLAGLEPATRGVETHCSNPTELQAHNQLAICIIQAIAPDHTAFTRSAQISFASQDHYVAYWAHRRMYHI